MKQKTGRKLLSFLLTLALVLGLMPGMGLTAYAAPTETLLTTITATAKEQASYSTANVATVSFSYTAEGSSAYLANWGWWGYGWTATVAPANGYTITKCVFYDDANRTATDSEAPFVVETTEEDKTPKVNGIPILANTSKGIKKIEVYGYAASAHTHSFTYSASGATITATCTAAGCDLDDGTEQHNNTATLTIAAEGGTYDGTTAYSATVTNNIPAVTGDTVGSVAYYKVDTEGATTGGTAQAGAPTGAGYYYASVTLTSGSNTYTAVKAFTVAKIDPTAPTDLTATYGQKLSDVALPTGWTWADSTQSVGNVVSPTATFKANFAGNDNYNAASNVDVAVTVSKADATTAMQAASVSIEGTSGKTATVSYTIPDGASYGTVTNSNTDFFTVDTTSGLVLTAANNWTASEWATDAPKTFTVAVSGATNYNDYTLTVTVTPTYKATQTITASDVTATYGDTGKKIEASTTGDGGLSYAVKSGDAVTVDASGNLTIVKAGSAVITVTAAETDTYAQATMDVNVTVNTKAMTVSAEDVNVTVDGQAHSITVTVTDPASGATVKYGTEAGSYTLDASPTQTEVGEKTVYYQVTADNYTTYTGSAKVTVSAKQTQTISAENVTATYGDTDKSVSATVTDPATGGGDISYAVKEGSGDYIEINASTGALTIKAVPADGKAYVIVTAAETSTYTQATKEVTVTINKANAAAATVTANNRTYDGTEKPLVTVTGTPTGGTMQYALGTATEATQPYTTSIPTKTEAGTYYVWYKVDGDDNHNDTGADFVPVTIAQASIADAVVTLSSTSLVYTGSEQSVSVTSVKLREKMLTADTDYEVSGETTGTNKGTYTVTVTGKGNYKDTAKAQWTIDQMIPTITTVPTATAITYGQTLKDSTLSGGVAKNGDAEVAGTFAWKDSTIAPAVSDSETTEYDVVFTPTDTENYGTAECKVKLTVNPASEPEDTSDGDATFTPGDTESGVQGLDKESVEKQMEELAGADETPCGDNQTKDVKVTLDVSSTSETSVGSDEKSAILSIIGDQDGVQVDYLEITVKKSVTLYDVDGNGNKTNPQSETTTMHELGKVVDIPVKYDMTGKQNPTVVRYHDGHTAVFTRLDAAPAAADMRDGTFYIEGSGKDAIIHIYSSMFSTYAILTNAEAPASPAVITVAPAAKDLTWTGAAQELVTAGTAEGGTMQYAPGADATTAPADGWSAAIPAGTNAGTYYVWYKAVGDATHTESAAGCVAVEIKKAKAVITVAPVAVPGLIWTGAPQALVTAGTAEGGTVIYALGVDATTAPADGWSETVPSATEAGTYYVWYKAVGDANHSDSARDCVVAAIAQKEREKPSGNLNPLLKTKGLKALTLSWTPMANVDGYDVFMAKCTSEFSSEPYATLTPEASQMEFGKLKKKTSYKVNIRAFVLKDGVKEYVGQNEILHCITGGANQKFTNAAKISAKNMSLAVGDKKQAKVTVKGQKKGKAILSHGGAVRFLSSDPSIATVSDKGFVRGVGEGSCTIFLSTHNGLRTTITVTVTGGPEELKFDQKSYKLSIGKTLKLKGELKLFPEGTKAELKWKSSDKKIATVDENGKVTAKKAGTVKITVTTSNGITATVKIKIK